MFKRVTWFVTGAAAGLGGSVYAKRRLQDAVDRLAPEHVQAAARARARAIGDQVVDAVREGRAAMRVREAELRHPGGSGHRAIDTTGRVAATLVDGPSGAPKPVRRQRAAQ